MEFFEAVVVVQQIKTELWQAFGEIWGILLATVQRFDLSDGPNGCAGVYKPYSPQIFLLLSSSPSLKDWTLSSLS